MKTYGFTLIETLIVVAIVGILITLGVANIPRDKIQVNETARIVTADLLWARSQAIRINGWLKVSFNASANSYAVYKDEDQDGVAEGAAILTRILGSEYPLADITGASFTNAEVWFDVRGIPRNLPAVGTITIASASNGAYKRCVLLEPQGRVTTKDC